MKYVMSFDSNYYNKLDLDNMSDDERWELAWQCMGFSSDEAQIVTLDDWIRLYNDGCVPESGSVYIYLTDRENEDINISCPECCDKSDDVAEVIDEKEAWRFFDEVAEPQTRKYIEEYDGDMSVFWREESKAFWYEVWVDLQEDWLGGECLYKKCKDMDLAELGKFLFEKLCKYEAYYDSPQWIEDLNRIAEVLK